MISGSILKKMQAVTFIICLTFLLMNSNALAIKSPNTDEVNWEKCKTDRIELLKNLAESSEKTEIYNKLGDEFLRSTTPQACEPHDRLILAKKYYGIAFQNESRKSIQDDDAYYASKINLEYVDFMIGDRSQASREIAEGNINSNYKAYCRDNKEEEFCDEYLQFPQSSPEEFACVGNCNYLQDHIVNDGRLLGSYCVKCPPLP